METTNINDCETEIQSSPLTLEQLLEKITDLTDGWRLYFKRKSDMLGWGVFKSRLFFDLYVVLANYTDGKVIPIKLPFDYRQTDYLKNSLCSILTAEDNDEPCFYLITEEQAGEI